MSMVQLVRAVNLLEATHSCSSRTTLDRCLEQCCRSGMGTNQDGWLPEHQTISRWDTSPRSGLRSATILPPPSAADNWYHRQQQHPASEVSDYFSVETT